MVLTTPHHGSEIPRAEASVYVFTTKFPFWMKAVEAAVVTSLSAKKALRIVIPGAVAETVAVAALDTVDNERTDLVEEEGLGGDDMAEVLLLIIETFVNALVGALVVLEEV
jgi:hypothetical protein